MGKTSLLPSATTPLTGNELVEIEQKGAPKKVTITDLGGGGGGGSMVYPGAGIPVSTGSTWGTSIPAGTDGKVLTMVSGAPAWAAAPIGLPSMTGNGGKFLTTDGTGASWANLTGWSTTGNAGTDGGTTNFIGTTDSKKLVFKTNNRIYGFFHENGGLILKSPYNSSNDTGLWLGSEPGTSTFYINGGGIGKDNTADIFVSAGAWNSEYSLVFGTSANKVMTINSKGITVKALTVSATSITLPSGGKLDFGSTAIETTSPYIAMRYNGVNGWRASIMNGTTNVLVANSQGLININPAGAVSIASAALSVTSTTLGFLQPRMTSTQWAAIASKAEGLQGWNTTDHAQMWFDGTRNIGFRFNGTKFQGYDGTTWVDLN